MAMNVSLCGPHSLETSTFVGVDALGTVIACASAPLLAMKRYLSHHVGSCELFAASTGLPAASASANEAIAVRMYNLRVGKRTHTPPNLAQQNATCVRREARRRGASRSGALPLFVDVVTAEELAPRVRRESNLEVRSQRRIP